MSVDSQANTKKRIMAWESSVWLLVPGKIEKITYQQPDGKTREKSSSDEINYIMKENSIRLMISLVFPLS